MKILITGGTGYLGGRIATHLAAFDRYDILIGTRNPDEKKHLLPGIKKAAINLADPAALKKLCEGADIIIHLAAMNAGDCAASPAAAFEANTVGTARLLEAAVKAGVKRFIYFSTAHVYSSPLKGSIDETTCPVSLHPYATSHRGAEDIVRGAHSRGEIEGIVVRLSNAFGAPAHKEADCWMLLANDLCRQAVTMKLMQLHTSGLQRRDFVTVTDVCRATEHLLHIPVNNGTNIFNVGGDWAPTVWELALLVQQTCAKVLGFQPDLLRKTPGADEADMVLDYRINRLVDTGFRLSSNREEELQQLLLFCKSSF